MSKVNLRSAIKISFDDWISTDICECGGPVFKYNDVSKNNYIAKCGYTKETLETDPKTKKKLWIKSKKQPCKFVSCFQGKKEIYNKKISHKKNTNIENPHLALHNQLKSLFTYLFIEEKDTFIQEIDYIVRIRLERHPRKVYVFKDSKKISHKESLKEYHDRIFSEEIIDLTSKYTTNMFDIQSNQYIEPDIEPDIESDGDPEELESEEEEEIESEEEESDDEILEEEEDLIEPDAENFDDCDDELCADYD
jgi:predicted nucleic-acid-binding Zn-ribbon protein